MNDPPPSPKSRWRASQGLILIGLALVGFLIWYYGGGNLLAVFRQAQPAPLGWMAVLILAGFWLRAWKWRYALGPGRQAIGLFFLAKMAGNWTPGRLGELSPLLIKRHRTAKIAAWILADRILEVALTLLMGLLGALSLGTLSAGILYLLAGAGALSLPALLILLLRPSALWAFLSSADPESLKGRLCRLIRAFLEELRYLGPKTPAVILLTLIAKVTDILAVMALCQAFGYEPGFLLVCTARCAHALVSAVPVTPDATGVPFVAAALLLHAYAAIPYKVLTVALAFEVAAINFLLWFSFCLAAWDLRGRAPQECDD